MWDERYASDEYVYGTKPNDFLREHFHNIPAGGDVLCLAEGEGRNAVFLAKQGYAVTAVDFSQQGKQKAEKLAASHGAQIDYQLADLAEYDLGENRWDGIVSIFCHLPPAARKRVHQQVLQALKPGGAFLLEAYTPGQLGRGTGGPPDADLMMTPELLREELTGLQFRHLHELERDIIEGCGHTGVGAVTQLVASRRAASFSVSANRGHAAHRVRYVESGGGRDDTGECRLCAGVLPSDPDTEKS